MVYQRKHDYGYREGWRPNIEANVVGEVIEQIEDQHGAVTGQLFLDASRPEESPTHKVFEWDDTKAAEKFRLHQATQLICAIRVIVKDKDEAAIPEKPQRAFVNIAKENSEGRYISITSAMAKEETREIVLRRALRELDSFRQKYSDLSELAGVFDAISAFEERSRK